MTAERRQVGWGFWLWWVLASTGGVLGIAMIASVGIMSVGETYHLGGKPVVLWLDVVPFWAVGGASLGITQWLILRLHVSRAGWWLLANTAAGAAGGIVGWVVFGAVNGFQGLLVSAALFGAITGLVLVWLLRQPVPQR